MENSNVMDLFYKRPYTKITAQDYKSNAAITNESGVYLGVLKIEDSNLLRRLTRKTEFKQTQIEQLTNQNHYNELLQHCLHYLKIPSTVNINDDKDVVIIDKAGHTWVIYDFEHVQNEYLDKKGDK